MGIMGGGLLGAGIMGIPGDPNDVRLLIHSDSSDGNQTFTDSGGNRSPVTVANAEHSTDITAKFCATSMHFDGTGDAITIDGKAPDAAFDFGGNEFSIDFWWYATVNSDERDGLIGLYNNATNYEVHIGLGGDVTNWSTGGNKVCLSINYDSGWQYQGIGTTDICDSDWHNIRLVRNGTSWKVYVDGTAEITTTQAFGVPSCHCILGAHVTTGRWANGYMDEVYIVANELNSSNFTPRIAPWEGYSCAL
jgi:hypothetical protein